MRPTGLLPVLVVVAVAQSAAATAQELTYSGTIQYASGRYIFTEPTRTLSLYNALTLTSGRLRFGASVPVLLQNSGAVTLVGGGSLPTGGMGNGAVGSRQEGEPVQMGPGGPRHALLAGSDVEMVAVADSVVEQPGSYEVWLGDPLVHVGLALVDDPGPVRSVELTGSVKLPLNDLDSGVGTGEWDYAVGVAAAAAVGPVLTFLDVAYWWYGDLPALELRDGLAWGGGVGLPVSRSVWVSAMATATNRVIESAEAARGVSLGVSYRLAGAGTLSVAAGAGLTEASPDLTVSVGWRRSLAGP